MDRYADVIVVGAGQAGCAAAYDLAQQGWQVLLLDKTDFPRFKPCAGGVTPKALHRYRFSIAPVIRETSEVMAISYRRRFHRTLRADHPICALTVRSELDEFVWQKAQQAGAKFEVIDKITGIEQTAESVVLKTATDRYHARYLIGADGAHSRVRKLTQDFTPSYRAVAMEGCVTKAKLTDSARQAPFTFDFGIVRHGYGWLFPKGDHINVGLYTWRPEQVSLSKQQLREYCHWRLGTDQVEHIAGYPIATSGENYSPAQPRVLLAGDAAGMAEPILGEGIHNAVKSGQAAAEVCANALQDNSLLQPQASPLFQTVLHDLYNCRRVAGWFYGLLPLAHGAISHPPIRTMAMNGFAAGMTVTECKRALLSGNWWPEVTLSESLLQGLNPTG